MNSNIIFELNRFEKEGQLLLLNIQTQISHATNQKDFGDTATDILGSKVLPRGWISPGKKLARKSLSQKKQSVEVNCARQADQWLNEITTSLSSISRKNSSLTMKGNSQTLVKKFNYAKKGAQAKTKINRGLKALDELKQLDLIYNKDIGNLLQEKKLKNTPSDQYNQYAIDAKILLRDYPSELEAFLGAIERLEQGGLDANRQCLSSCRNCIESLVKRIAQRWPDGLISIIPSNTKRKIVKQTYQFLSAFGVHGSETPTDNDAKSGLEQTLSSIRLILSHKNEECR